MKLSNLIEAEYGVYDLLNQHMDQIKLDSGPRTFRMLQTQLALGKEAYVKNFLKVNGYLEDPDDAPPNDKALPFEEQIKDVIKKEIGECWKTYKQVGMKKKGNKMVPNCVPRNEGMSERDLSDKEEKIAQDLPDKEFKKRYGKDWKSVKIATATKMAKNEGDTYEKMAAKGKKKGNLKQGTVRKRLKIKDGEKIPLSKITKAISKIKKIKNPSEKNKKFLKALNLAKTLKTTTHKESISEADPKKGTGKKPKGSGRRLYTDENPKDTVKVKFSTRQDIVDTLNKASFKSKSHKRQSQVINLIHQRVRAALNRAKDSDVKKRLRTAFDYIKN